MEPYSVGSDPPGAPISPSPDGALLVPTSNRHTPQVAGEVTGEVICAPRTLTNHSTSTTTPGSAQIRLICNGTGASTGSDFSGIDRADSMQAS
ncbi:MAG: hypothetical protein ABI600_08330 [Luteolibacter sp.]